MPLPTASARRRRVSGRALGGESRRGAHLSPNPSHGKPYRETVGSGHFEQKEKHMKDWRRRVLRNFLSEERITPIVIAAAIAIVAIAVLWFFSTWYDEKHGAILPGVYVEAAGAVMDIVVFGIILALLSLWTNRNRERTLDIARQKELIDDFKKWDSDEARHRIAGAIRRLNRLRCTMIDFSGIELSNFSFEWNDIRSIAGSTFYDGSWGTGSRRERVILEEVDFATVDCRNVMFSKFNPFGGFDPDMTIRFATFRDCNFRDSQLQEAIFCGAYLEWSEKPPEEVGEWEDFGDGHGAFHQTYWPPFDGADLKGASFEEVAFRNADFRGAENIESCIFAGAKGLDECLFDDEKTKKRILKMAQSRKR